MHCSNSTATEDRGCIIKHLQCINTKIKIPPDLYFIFFVFVVLMPSPLIKSNAIF